MRSRNQKTYGAEDFDYFGGDDRDSDDEDGRSDKVPILGEHPPKPLLELPPEVAKYRGIV